MIGRTMITVGNECHSFPASQVRFLAVASIFFQISYGGRAFYTLLFHSLFKVEFGIDHFVLGEYQER